MKRPLKNTLSIAGADIANRVLGFAVTVFLGRVLGAEAFGLVGIGFAVLGYLILLSSPGVHIIGIRDVAAGEGTGLASSVASLRLLLATPLFLGVVAWSVFFATSRDDALVVAIIAGSALPLAVSPEWFFQGKEQFVPVSVSRVSVYLVYLLLAVLFVHSEGDVALSAVAYTAGNLVAAAGLMALFRRRFGGMAFSWAPAHWRGLIANSLPIGLTSLLSQTVVNLPILIVGLLLTTHAAGLFNAAMKLIFFVLIIDRVFYAIFLPVASRHGREGGEKFVRLTLLAMRLVLVVTIPTAVIGIAVAPALIGIVFGAGYEGSGPVLACLLPYVVFTLMNTVIMTALVAVNKQDEYLAVMSWGTGFLILLCISLTLLYDLQGTAMSLTLGEAVMTGLFLLRARKTIGAEVSLACLPGLAGAAAMSAVFILLQGDPMILVLPLSFVCFLLTVYFTRGITFEDLRFLREKLV